MILIDDLHVLEVFDDVPSLVRYPTWMVRDLSSALITTYDSAGKSWRVTLRPIRRALLPEFVYLFLLRNNHTEVEVTYSECANAPFSALRSALEHVIGVDMTGLYHQYLNEEELADRLNQAQTFREVLDLLTMAVFPDEAMRRVSKTSELAEGGKASPATS